MDELLKRVKERIDQQGLKHNEAAKQIGVTPTSLERHLAGAYVRSDSLARYRGWLDGRTVRKAPTPILPDPPPSSRAPTAPSTIPCPPFTRGRLYNVIDLFSGSGGMSLGFDLLTTDAAEIECFPAQPIFQTILALDLEDKVVALHNDNHLATNWLQGRPARWVNIADFVNTAEILAFYLDHLTARSNDETLTRDLDRLPQLGCAALKELIRQLDAHFLSTLSDIRSAAAFRREYGSLDSTVGGQTSVIGFQRAVGLPETATNRPRLGPLVWVDHETDPSRAPDSPALPAWKHLARMRAAARKRLSQLWDVRKGANCRRARPEWDVASWRRRLAG